MPVLNPIPESFLKAFLAIAISCSSWALPISTPTVQAFQERAIPLVSIRTLPIEAQQTIQLINRGGPFPYRQDGTIFGNREGRLPNAPRGTYREYTVRTPGARDRGARRLITGQKIKYYSPDHYRSFQQVRE